MILFIILFIVLIIIVNELIKCSHWFQTVFGDSLKFKNVPNELQVVNLGSNSGKFDFDYSDCEIIGMNWAVGPQTITFDYKILQKYIHYIRKNGNVLLPISLFSSIKDAYTGSRANDKYYQILSTDSIPDYSKLIQIKVEFQKIFPIGLFIANPKRLIHLYRARKPFTLRETNPMNEIQLIEDSLRWVENWKKEFDLDNLNSPLSEKYAKIQDENRTVLINMIELCLQSGLRPVIVLPPVTNFLLFHLTPKIRQIYIYDFLNEVIERTGVKLLDYMENIELSDPDLYFNSFFLNAIGRKKFTQRVLEDIN